MAPFFNQTLNKLNIRLRGKIKHYSSQQTGTSFFRYNNTHFRRKKIIRMAQN
jgi:hypothetical protein